MCAHVIVRHDAVWKPIQQPHDRPYKVLQCSDETFIVDINGGRDTIFIDRLKPAFLDAAPEPSLPLTNRSTRTTTILTVIYDSLSVPCTQFPA